MRASAAARHTQLAASVGSRRSCVDGYALAGTACRPCGDASSNSMLLVTLVLLIVLFLVVWIGVGWKPFFTKEKPEVPSPCNP